MVGWLSSMESSRYAMVERFQYEEHKPYPGKASVIFWTNGSHLRFDNDGEAAVAVSDGAERRISLLYGSRDQ